MAKLRKYWLLFKFWREILAKAKMLTTKNKEFQKQETFEVTLSPKDYTLLRKATQANEEGFISVALKRYQGRMKNVENRNGDLVITVIVH